MKTKQNYHTKLSQKQSSEVLYKRSCSYKFSNIHRKPPVFKSHFNKIADLTYLKETPTEVFSCEYCEILKSTYFEEHLRMATSTQWKAWITWKSRINISDKLNELLFFWHINQVVGAKKFWVIFYKSKISVSQNRYIFHY